MWEHRVVCKVVLALLLYMCLLAQLGSAVNTDLNFYSDQQGSEKAINGRIGGQIKVTFTYYQPTCGWQMLLKSYDFNLYNLSSNYSYSWKSVDSHNIILTNIDNTANLHGSVGFSITIQGDFGNTTPNITIWWSCVCDDTTSGLCKPVSMPGQVQGRAESPLFHLEKVSGSCYTGEKWSRVSGPAHLLLCAATCLHNTTCLAINFWTTTHTCHLVWESTDTTSVSTSAIDGCQLYKVVLT